MTNLKLFCYDEAILKFLEALMKDASALINKMKQKLNTRNMRLVK